MKKNKVKIDRNEAARAVAKKAQEKRQEENEKHQDRLRKIRLKNEYIKCFVKGRYYLERCNMLVGQLNDEHIVEEIDGVKKTPALVKAEYYMLKQSAVSLMRECAWNKQELLTLGLTEDDITAVHEEYLGKPIVRDVEEYDKEYQRERFATFVPE